MSATTGGSPGVGQEAANAADAPSAADAADRDEALRLIADSVADVVAAHAGPARARRVHAGAPVTDAPTWRALAQLGWLGVAVPESAGGLALGAPAVAVIAEAAGRALMTAPLGAAWAAGQVLAAALASTANADGHHPVQAGPARAWLADTLDALLAGTAPVVLADAESGAGGVLHAALVPDGAVAPAWIVRHQRADGDVALRWVRVGTPGVVREDRVAVDGSLLSDLRIDPGAWTEAPPLLRGDAAARAWREARALQWLADAALLAGIADAAFRLALDYLRLRRQFGVAIGSFQALQHRAADLHVDLSATRALVREAARCLGDSGPHATRVADAAHGTDGAGGDTRGTWAAAAAVRRAAATAQRIGEETVQFHGGIGFADEHDAGLHLRRALAVGARHGRDAMARLRDLADAVD